MATDLAWDHLASAAGHIEQSRALIRESDSDTRLTFWCEREPNGHVARQAEPTNS
jgi:hypothetical protein